MIETDRDAKTTRLNWHNILSTYSTKYLKDALSLPKVKEQSLGTGR